MNEDIDKKWNEWPFSFPPVNTLVLAEYDTVLQEWYKGFVLALGDDADGEFCQFRWLEGPKTNQTTFYYTPESFRPLLPIENKEQKDSPKEEKSLDNLLKELHNLKQEQKAISNKIDNILNEINDVMKENGLAVVFTEKFNPHEYSD